MRSNALVVRRRKAVLMALLSPPGMYIALTGATHWLVAAAGSQGLEIPSGLFDVWLFGSIAASEIAGFIVLARGFRRFAIPLAVVYFPAMFVFLMWCGLLLSASTGNGP
jgi:hypothetical protein